MFWIEPSCTEIAIHETEARLIPFPTKCHKIGSNVVCPIFNFDSDNDKLKCELNLLQNATIHSECVIHTTTAAETWIPIDEYLWVFVLPNLKEMKIGNSTVNLTGSGILSYHEINSSKQINDSILISDESILLIPTVNLSEWIHKQPKLHRIRFTTQYAHEGRFIANAGKHNAHSRNGSIRRMEST